MLKMADEIDVDFFISLVQARPVLWDKTNDNFRDKHKKIEAWKDVCRIIFESFDEMDNEEKTKLGNELVKKWTNIKDNYMKHLKKKELLNKSGAGAKKTKEYHLYKQLMFLTKIAPNVTDNSIEKESGDPKIRNNTRSRYQPYTRTSRKNNEDDFEAEILEKLNTPENRHVSFFKSILPFLEKLDDYQTLTYQSRIMQILMEFNQPSYQYNQPPYQYNQTPRQYDQLSTLNSGYHTGFRGNYQRSQARTRDTPDPSTEDRSLINISDSPDPSTEDRSLNNISDTPDPSTEDRQISINDILSNTQDSEFDFS